MLTNGIYTKPKSILENEMHKILWDIENKSGLPDPSQKTRRCFNQLEENNLSSSGFCHSNRPKSKNKKNNRQILGSCPRAEKSVECENDSNLLSFFLA